MKIREKMCGAHWITSVSTCVKHLHNLMEFLYRSKHQLAGNGPICQLTESPTSSLDTNFTWAYSVLAQRLFTVSFLKKICRLPYW